MATSASTHADRPTQELELLLTTPPHFADYENVRNELRSHGFIYSERFGLGALRLVISSTDFKRARVFAVDYTRHHSLTLRIARDLTSSVWEVWELGTKQREESYLISPSSSR